LNTKINTFFCQEKSNLQKNVGSKGYWKDLESRGENRAGWIKIMQYTEIFKELRD
jgi:hypothetical protein